MARRERRSFARRRRRSLRRQRRLRSRGHTRRPRAYTIMLHTLLAAATAWSAPTTATPLYIDPAHGNDANDGSAAHPFRTAQYLQNQATPGASWRRHVPRVVSINKNSIAFAATARPHAAGSTCWIRGSATAGRAPGAPR